MLKVVESPSFPKESFEAKINPVLMSQAVRVFLANQREGTQSALTRAEVKRTRKKLYKQKGTGGARHGDRKAPIFVGGGIAFAPKPRDHSLSLSKNMKKRSLSSALSAKNKSSQISIVTGLSDLSGKTSEISKFISENFAKAKSILIVTDTTRDNIYRAGRNIANVSITPVSLLTTYEVLKADMILFMQEAISFFEKDTVEKEEKKSSKKEVKPKTEKVTPKKTVVKKAKSSKSK